MTGAEGAEGAEASVAEAGALEVAAASAAEVAEVAEASVVEAGAASLVAAASAAAPDALSHLHHLRKAKTAEAGAEHDAIAASVANATTIGTTNDPSSHGASCAMTQDDDVERLGEDVLRCASPRRCEGSSPTTSPLCRLPQSRMPR
jgi:hypothetical protein